MTTAALHPDALADLQKSGLSDETSAACGLHSVPPADLTDCPIPGVVHAIAFPYYALDGSPLDFQRWKLFYDGEPGDLPKYWQPKGSDPSPYYPPLINWQTLASDPTQSLLITEGEKKTLAACQFGLSCLGIAGVWNWRVKLHSGERLVLPGLDQIIWKGRTVEFVPDSDAWRPEKERDILAGFFALAMDLKERGAVVSFVELPDRPSNKRGLDDFFVEIPAFQRETFTGCKRYRLDDLRFKPLASWYQKWEKRQRSGGDVGLVKELADEIIRTDYFAKDTGGRLYAYVEGVYRPGGPQLISRQVKTILEKNADTKRWSTHLAGEVAAYVAVDAPDLWERPPLNVLNLKNGLLDVMTGMLSPSSPDHLSAVQLPIAFDPAATCAEWDAFISDVFPEDCQALAYETVAWLLCPDTSIQKAFLLRGDGENGKSTFLSGVTAALGVENVAGLSLQKLETDRFSVARLRNKLANICPDLPSDHLSSTSVFKALVGGDRVLGEYKYGESFEFLPFARLLFSANHFPQSKDSSYAFFRRWEVISFDRTITKEQRRAKPNLLARLTSAEELSGLLNRCLAVLPTLRSRGSFLQTETTTAARVEFQEYTDPLAIWIDRHTVLEPSGIVTKKDLLVKYSAESEDAGRPIVPARTFYAAVKRLRPTIQETMRRVNGNPRDVFIGLSLKETVRGVSAVSSTPLLSELNEEREKGRRKGGEIAVSAYTAYASYAPPTVDEDDFFDVGPS